MKGYDVRTGSPSYEPHHLRAGSPTWAVHCGKRSWRWPHLQRSMGTSCAGPVAEALGAERRTLRLPTMSGAVTDGIEWQLFTFKVGPDGFGGTYQRSIPVDADWSPATRAVLTGALKDLVRV